VQLMLRDPSAVLPFGGCQRSHLDHREPFEVGRQFGPSVPAQSDVGAAKPASYQTKLQHYVGPGHLDGAPSYRAMIVRGCYEDGAAAFEQHVLERAVASFSSPFLDDRQRPWAEAHGGTLSREPLRKSLI
jgi:hypothetical protein